MKLILKLTDTTSKHLLMIKRLSAFSSLEVDYFSSLEADFNNSTAAAAAVTGYEPWQKTLIGASAGALSLVTIAGNLMVQYSCRLF